MHSSAIIAREAWRRLLSTHCHFYWSSWHHGLRGRRSSTVCVFSAEEALRRSSKGPRLSVLGCKPCWSDRLFSLFNKYNKFSLSLSRFSNRCCTQKKKWKNGSHYAADHTFWRRHARLQTAGSNLSRPGHLSALASLPFPIAIFKPEESSHCFHLCGSCVNSAVPRWWSQRY